MYASNKAQEQSPWWIGIARFLGLSDTLIDKMLENRQRSLMLASNNKQLPYQQPIKSEPKPFPYLQYGIPQAESKPYLKQKQPFEDYFYRPSQGIEQPDLTRINGVENTLYQTTYQTQKYSFYQASKPSKAQEMFGYGNNKLTQLYEQPKSRIKALAYAQPIETVFYEPKHNGNELGKTSISEVATSESIE